MQDTVSALRREGWSVDVLTSDVNPILAAALDSAVSVTIVPRVPILKKLFMFLRGFSLASRNGYTLLHGMDDGADVARAIEKFSRRKIAYVAELHHPHDVRSATVNKAAAVIVAREKTLSKFRTPPPMARVSILPDPHAELADNAFTAAEFASAIGGIYTYVLRTRPGIGE